MLPQKASALSSTVELLPRKISITLTPLYCMWTVRLDRQRPKFYQLYFCSTETQLWPFGFCERFWSTVHVLGIDFEILSFLVWCFSSWSQTGKGWDDSSSSSFHCLGFSWELVLSYRKHTKNTICSAPRQEFSKINKVYHHQIKFIIIKYQVTTFVFGKDV